jgi:transposase
MPHVPPVPGETLRVTRAAFPKGNLCMQIRDVLEVVCTDTRFDTLFAWRGRPAEAPWRLVLVMLLQFAEGLSDRQAAEAVRGRIDWKYLLGLELTDPGFNVALLSHFSAQLSPRATEQLFLDALLTACQVSHVPNGNRRRRLDTGYLLTESRLINRLDRIAETFREALRAVTVAAPEWTNTWEPADWHIRYGPLARAALQPHGPAARRTFIETVRADGQCLLDALRSPDAPRGLSDLEVVQVLGRLWAREFSVRNGRTILRRALKLNSVDDAEPPHSLTRASLRARAGRLRWDLRRGPAA